MLVPAISMARAKNERVWYTSLPQSEPPVSLTVACVTYVGTKGSTRVGSGVGTIVGNAVGAFVGDLVGYGVGAAVRGTGTGA